MGGRTAVDELIITGDDLTIADVVGVARSKPGALSIRLDEKVYARVAASRKAVEQIVTEERIAYSINTRFGALQNCLSSRDALEALQRNLVLSHSVGVGEPLSSGEVRALILIRANVLAKGYSGVRLKALGRACRLGLSTAPIYKLVRQQIPFFDQDVFMQPYLLRARELILEGLVSKTVRQTLPNEFTIGKNPDEQNLS